MSGPLILFVVVIVELALDVVNSPLLSKERPNMKGMRPPWHAIRLELYSHLGYLILLWFISSWKGSGW
jgi:hypothetical protein